MFLFPDFALHILRVSRDPSLFASYFWWRDFYKAESCNHKIICHKKSFENVGFNRNRFSRLNIHHLRLIVTSAPHYTSLPTVTIIRHFNLTSRVGGIVQTLVKHSERTSLHQIRCGIGCMFQNRCIRVSKYIHTYNFFTFTKIILGLRKYRSKIFFCLKR